MPGPKTTSGGSRQRSMARNIRVFVAIYVLMGHTGAIMAVPAGQAGLGLATAYDLPIIRTVQPTPGDDLDTAFVGDGPAINSANDEISLDGLGSRRRQGRDHRVARAKGLGEGTVTLKLRDWLFSRQRYWGEPFPIVYDGALPHRATESICRSELPGGRRLQPAGSIPTMSPPSRCRRWPGRPTGRMSASTSAMASGPIAVNSTSCRSGRDPVGTSCVISTRQHRAVRRPRRRRYCGWGRMPLRSRCPAGATDVGGVDLYVGGVEHAVLHLLYSRFWHKVLLRPQARLERGAFRRLYNQGYIQAYAYRDLRGQTVPAAGVVESVAADGSLSWTWNGEEVVREFGKMGKSLKNVVTPDDMYAATAPTHLPAL